MNCDRFSSFMDAKVAWSRFIDGRKTFDGPGGTARLYSDYRETGS